MIAERFSWWLAWKMPRKIVTLCLIRAAVHATSGVWEENANPSTGELYACLNRLTYRDLVDRWRLT